MTAMVAFDGQLVAARRTRLSAKKYKLTAQFSDRSRSATQILPRQSHVHKALSGGERACLAAGRQQISGSFWFLNAYAGSPAC